MTSPSRDPQNRSVKEKEVIKGYQNSQVGAPVSINLPPLKFHFVLHPHTSIRFPVVAVVWAISAVLVLVMLRLETLLKMALLMKNTSLRMISRKNSTFL